MNNEETEFDEYEQFVKDLTDKYPEMFSAPYGGVAVGKGWWPIISSLCANIQGHIDHVESRKVWAASRNETVPESVPQVVVAQIKEKFGGLRFYYDGGDDRVYGMVRMAESWADRSCEQCGAPGKSGGKGWIQTLCPTHRAESDAAYKERFKDED